MQDEIIDNKVRPKKQLGQHFLTSEKAINDIVGCLDTKISKITIEIGPGTGVLTKALLIKGFTVIALEIDKESIRHLQENFSDYIQNKKLFLIEKDCLEIDFGELVGEIFSEKLEKYYLVGNIPYYITGLIFRNTFVSKYLPEKVIYLVQKEVAERVVAKDKKESILSLSVKLFGDAKIIFTVKKGSFNPPPKVDSAILEISNIKKPFKITSYDKEILFFKLIKAAFLHKRKYALSNIEKYIIPDEKFLNKIKENISEKQRAEDIPLGIWTSILE